MYVSQSGAGNQSGSSWSNALPGDQLQNHLASAGTGTQFWVAGGTYKPTTGTDRTVSFFIPSGVQVYGGFVGTENSLNDRKLPQPSNTVLTGAISVPVDYSKNSYHVVSFLNASNNTRLDGVTITAGTANFAQDNNDVGAGIFINGSNGRRSEPVIVSCSVRGNYAISNGGGVYNNAYSGVCNPTLINCVIQTNGSAGGLGGGMYNNGTQGVCNPTLVNCIIAGNSAVQGSAIHNEAFQGTCSPTITNCVFKDNLHSQFGGGVLFNRNSSGTCQPVVTNCIFWENPYSRPSIHNENASPVVTYCDIEDGYPGTGNISQDPQFFDFYYNDFRLLKTSPAINAGAPDNTTPAASMTDFEGKLRVLGDRIDMGTVEFIPNSVTGVVDVTQSGSGDYVSGSSWQNALPAMTLRAALSESAPSTVFWVAKGTYNPTFTVGDRTSSFFIPSDVQVYGGFNGNETSLSERVLTQPSNTTLSGNMGYTEDIDDNSLHIVTFSNASVNTRLDGVVITSGNANVSNLKDGNGGGVLNTSTQPGVISNPTIANCYFINNEAFSGGAMYTSATSGSISNPTLINCYFVNNSAREGGGLLNSGGSATANPTLIDCYFENNTATVYNGGAISNLGTIDANGIANLTLKNCTFTKNKAAGYGGAVNNGGFSGQANPVISNCTYLNNTATYGGGAINNSGYFGGQCSPVLVNCLFAGNTASTGAAGSNEGNNGRCDPMFTNCTFVQNNATTSGGALQSKTLTDTGFPYSCNVTIKSCIFKENRAPDGGTFKNTGTNTVTTITYSNIQGGFLGTGNIDQDPQFVDAANGNYRLKAGSPCINAGDPSSNAANVSEKDLDANPRVADNRIDIGSYEFQATSQTGSDLSLNLRTDNRTPNTNQPISCFLTVTNNGPVTATNIVWQNRLPDNLNFVSGDGVALFNRVLSGQINSLASGASTTFTYRLQPAQAGQYINAVQITASGQPDPDSQPNSGTGDGQDDAASIEIRTPNSNDQVFASANPDQVPLPLVQSNQPIPDPNKIDLNLRLAVSNRTPKVGDVLTYVLTVTNQGGTTANNVSVTAYLPIGQQFSSSTDMALTGGGITGGLSSIVAGGKAVLQFKTRVTATGLGILKAQVRQANPTDTDSTADNGTENGEDDTTQVDLRIVAQ